MVLMDGEVGAALSGLGYFLYVFPQGLHPGLVSPLTGLTTPLQGVLLRCGVMRVPKTTPLQGVLLRCGVMRVPKTTPLQGVLLRCRVIMKKRGEPPLQGLNAFILVFPGFTPWVPVRATQHKED